MTQSAALAAQCGKTVGKTARFPASAALENGNEGGFRPETDQDFSYTNQTNLYVLSDFGLQAQFFASYGRTAI